MADSNAPWRNRPAQMNPSNSNSPLSPASGGSNPVSFRPNVNRAKTKRWVEAKQYSYDGGDWGSEDEEEEEEEPPAPVRPPYTTQRTTSSSELSSRRLPGLGLGSEESRASPGVEPKDQQPSQQSTTAPLQSVDSAPLGSEGPNVLKTSQNNPMGLPEVKRFSGFGTDFFTGTDSNQQPTDPNPDQNALRHNPSQASESSQGFRSVVHQAFDVPETPNSTANSVTRSNSDGTSVISPIMGQRVPADDKTPTIPEEPADSSTPTGVPADHAAEAPFFKPGHRRDISLPERDNSPSKRPLVTDHETPAAGRAELTSVSPGQENTSPERPVEAGAQPTIPSTTTTDGDFVAPLKFGSAGTSGSEGYRGSIPAIVGANTSPNEADNDRLREEIMRSLSRENSQEPEERPQPSQSGNPNEDSIPQQFEKYWENSNGPGEGTPKALASETQPAWTSSIPSAPQDPYAVPSQAAQPLASEPPQKPKLGRRFSWESSSSADEPAQPVPGSYQSPPDGLAPQEPEPIPDYDDSHLTAHGMTDGEISGTESQKAERPRLSIVPPVSQNTTPPEQVIPPVSESHLDLSLPDYTRSSTVDESKLQGFRDILQITTPVARIRAFEETRNQFAVLDTGLNHWLQVTLNDQPQHAHLVQESQTLSSGFPKSSPTTRRFPKLTSLGTLSASREDGTPTSASHVRRPSGHIGTIVNRQNVEQRGKEFLHTAGTFGGKAGEAAKGLFAKGRSKFRQGGNDKGQSPSARKSLQFQFSFGSESAKSTGYSGKTPRRNSLNFNSLPVFKFGRSEDSTHNFGAKDPASIEDSQDDGERRGKRFKSNEPSDSLGTRSTGAGRNEQAEGAGFVTDFAQEMNAALGLSPTETRAQQTQQVQKTASDEPVRASRPIPPSGSVQAFPEPTGAPKQTADARLSMPEDSFISADDAEANTYLASLPLGDVQGSDKDLPTPPTEHIDDSASSEATNPPIRSGKEASHTTIPSIRAVSEEDMKPPTPPKDLSVREPGWDALPPVPMKDLTPKADNPPRESEREESQNHLAPPQDGHAPRQPSVSTLGEEEGQIPAQDSEEENSPPSPIQAATRDVDGPRPEDATYGEPVPPAQISRASIPPAESTFPGFTPHPAMSSPSSQEILESKRRSISGLPPSAPGVQSPLRNEVRYSPGTRSSMMSFGSFGRPSTNNSRGTRPNTPGNDLSQQAPSGSAAQNGDSKMDKLKSFGRRRRASVGNILTGLQGDLQGVIQGDQDRPQKKRGFSRISGFFGRQQESQQSTNQSEQPRKTAQAPSTIKALPTPPSKLHENGSTELNGHNTADRSSMDKALPVLPAPENGNETARSSLDRQRASISGPPTTSNNSGGSRFYSQLMSGVTQDTPTQHTRSQSQPLMISHPLSPVPPSESEHSSSDPSASLDEWEKEESPKESPPVPPKSPVFEEETKAERDTTTHKIDVPESAQESATQPILAPGLTVVQGNPESTTQIAESDEPKNIVFSGYHVHPHREGEPRTLNEKAEPVELPLSRDDSSEEIVMSPTAYPGQEWTPIHYSQ